MKEFFLEEQKFNFLWIQAGLIFAGLFLLCIFGFGINQQVFHGKPFGDNPMSDSGLVLTFFLLLLFFIALTVLFRTSKLIIKVDMEAINFRFVPFHKKFHQLYKSEIENFASITYNPVGDYGGWGIRNGRKGKAYNISGNKGILIRLKSGKTILFGTQRPDAFLHALKKMMGTD